MTMMQLFLLANALLVGVVGTLAVQFWLAHRHGSKPTVKSDRDAPVPAAVRERIAKQAEENFQGIVNRSALQLQHDLKATGAQLNKLLEKFGSEVLEDEMKLFHDNVADIRKATESKLSVAESDIAKQQTDIMKMLADRQADMTSRLAEQQAEQEAQLAQEMDARRAELTTQFEQKLEDSVMAFLLETLGHEVDLGAQADYIMATLEANKDQLKKGLAREA